MKSEYEAYPFLSEKSRVCDYEVMTDKYASEIGLIYSKVNSEDKDNIKFLCELVYHLNPCVRNDCTITDYDIERLLKIQYEYCYLVPRGFILPLSNNEVSGMFHVLRSEAKQIVRLLYSLEEDGKVISQKVFDCFNILSQIFFEYALLYADVEIKFNSRTYEESY